MLIPLLYQDIHLLDQDIHLLFIKQVLALCPPYESYQNQFWLYCSPIGRPMSAALLLGGPLAPYELCPPIGRPFGAIWALPSYWAPLLRHFNAAQSQGWA